MFRKSKFFFLFFYVFFSLSFVFENSSASEQILITAQGTNVGPLNPHLYDPSQMYAQGMVYDGLIRYTAEGIKPNLAKSWNISEDGKVYTFLLKDNLKFSDGTILDAYAIEQSFAAIMANKERHAWLNLIGLIENFKAIDEKTFALTLKSPYLMTLEELSLPRPFRILSPSAFLQSENGLEINTSKGIKAPIGSGAYALVETKLGEYDYFARNEYYHGEKPDFSHIKILVLPDPHSRVIALETGKVDILLGEGCFSVEDFLRVSKNPNFTGEKSAPRVSNLLTMHSNRSATKDIYVRKAISHAINKEAIIKYIMLDQEEIAYQIYNPALPFAQVGITPYTYDIEKANDLLDQTAWIKKGAWREKDGKRLTLNLYYLGTSSKDKSIAEVIQADLMQVGIEVKLHAEEFTIFNTIQVNGDFDLVLNKTWGPPYDPHFYTASMLVRGHADYQAQLGMQEKSNFDSDIRNIASTQNTEEIQALYRNILNTLHEEAIYFPISYELDFSLYDKNKVGNFKFGEMSTEFMFHELKALHN